MEGDMLVDTYWLIRDILVRDILVNKGHSGHTD